jgi:hypothetical protein
VIGAKKGLFVSAALALVLAAGCGGDDDEPTPTAVATPTAATASPSPTDTPAASGAITIEVASSVRVPFDVSGEANVFEGALTVDVLDGAGDMLCVRHVQATSGTGTPGTWTGVIAFPPPDAELSATVRAYSFSAMDGSMENLVEEGVLVSTEHPAIFITTPVCGATVAPGGTLAVTGRAAVFEAALTVELRAASGAVVAGQNVMAASGVEESDFSVSLTVPPATNAGMYDLVAYSHSAMDGSVINEFPVQIIVEP